MTQRLTGDYEGATTRQSEALRLFQKIGDRRGQAWALEDLGFVELLTGNYPAAAGHEEEAWSCSRRSATGRARPGPSAAWVPWQQMTGEHHAAAATLKRARQLCQELGDRNGQAEAADRPWQPATIVRQPQSARNYYYEALKSPAKSRLVASKPGHWRDSDDPTSRKETSSKAPYS